MSVAESLETTLSQNRAASRAASYLVLAAVFVLSVAFMAARVTHRFVPEDDGALGHQAERVLNGEVPHLDYHDIQTGGLSYLHAAAFRVFGVRVLSMRLALLALFSLWVPAVWYIARKFVSVGAAAGVTLLTAGLSVPIYPCPQPDWYNLYFATFGTTSLLRFLDTRSWRWIFVAGLFGASSVLMSVRGLYFIAAVLFFLTFDEQVTATEAQADNRVRNRIYSVSLTLGLAVFVSLLLLLIRHRLSPAEAFHFVLPSTFLAAVLVINEWRIPRDRALRRFQRAAGRLLPFAAGFAVPVAIFLTRYTRPGAVVSLFRGVFILPAVRVHSLFLSAPPPWLAILSAPLFLLLFAQPHVRHRLRAGLYVAGAACVLGGLLFFSTRHRALTGLIWFSVSTSIPVGVAIGTWKVLRDVSRNKLVSSEHLMLVLSVAAMFSLVQFPYSGPIYFIYATPLWILALTALASGNSAPARWWVLAPTCVFYFVFVLLQTFPTSIYTKGLLGVPLQQKAFTLPRVAPVKGDVDMVDLYDRLIPEVRKRAGGEPIYAGADATEVYFLSGLPNPTSVIVEFLAGADAEPSHILHAIDSAGVSVAVLNHGFPNYSGPLAPEIESGLRARFPQSTIIGRFEVRWK